MAFFFLFDFKAVHDTVDREQILANFTRQRFSERNNDSAGQGNHGAGDVLRACFVEYFEPCWGLRKAAGVVRRAGIDTSGTIVYKSVKLLDFADDTDIVARNQKTAKDIDIQLKAEAIMIGRCIQ